MTKTTSARNFQDHLEAAGMQVKKTTPWTASDVLDVDYSELWARVRAAKHVSPDREELRMAEDEDEDGEGRSEATTQITDTTSIQPHKTSRHYAEEMLHPRWIAISEDIRGDEMEHLETQLDLRCAGDDGAAPLESGLRTIQNTIGDLFADIASEQSEKIDNSLKWSDGTGSFYVISDAPYPLPPSRPLPATSNIQMVYDAGGVSAVWSISDAFCRVKILDPCATQEHVTLDYLHNKHPLSFATLDVHYHAEYDGRYYIILSRLTGQTLIEA
ncbi:hypothetical protein G7Y89_g778 [Cudoniella acicularis]|uniref:Uncharacterized protein n=1 Tax=Cudoniella acicularis TaxID=354080 RepID=A0A8H4RXJ5_9HELO|nr:hypothetical protein G7Y89_g778 [Cudoniella acicularis]